MVAAETGSGKTAAFSLPLLQIVHEDLRGRSSGAAKSTGKQGGGSKGRDKDGGGCRISRIHKDGQMVVSADGLSCQCEESNWAGARGEVGVRGGVHCFEVTLRRRARLCLLRRKLARKTATTATAITNRQQQ